MPVDLQCTECGHGHRIPDRRFDPATGGTGCPACGAREYTVRHDGLRWHPE